MFLVYMQASWLIQTVWRSPKLKFIVSISIDNKILHLVCTFVSHSMLVCKTAESVYSWLQRRRCQSFLQTVHLLIHYILNRIEFFSVQTSCHVVTACFFTQWLSVSFQMHAAKCDMYVNPYRVCDKLMLLYTMQATNFLPLQLVHQYKHFS